MDGLVVLTFDIPAQRSFSPEPESTLATPRSPAAQTALSLSASTFFPFAGLASNQNFLPNSRQVAFPGTGCHSLTTTSQTTSAAGVGLCGSTCRDADVVNASEITSGECALFMSNMCHGAIASVASAHVEPADAQVTLHGVQMLRVSLNLTSIILQP